MRALIDRGAWPRGAAAVAVIGVVAAGGCGNGAAFAAKQHNRYDRRKLERSLQQLERPGLVIGEFKLARHAVVDGDTLKVEGLETTLRLLAIDTEELFHHAEDRRLYERGWEAYLRAKRGDSVKPVKLSTPMGERAAQWAAQWFDGVATVRLERDHPKELRGRYGRYLTYVFARKHGRWVMYNLAAVRAGMTPYFTKYGYSRRFHDRFVAAQRAARAAHRGIWSPRTRHAPDYDERIAWWSARARFVRAFERAARGRDDFIVLGRWDALQRLEQHVGKPVELLATIGSIHLGDKGPTKVMLSRRLHSDFPLIYFDKDMFGSSGVARWLGEFVRVQGTVQRYTNKRTGKQQLQIVIDLPGQVVGPDLPWFHREKGAPR